MAIVRKTKKSSMQSLIIVAVVALIFILYSRNSNEVKTYVDHEGIEQFQITVSKDIIVETNSGWSSEKAKEAFDNQGIYIYFDQEKEDGIYFYIADSDRTYDDILDMQPGANMDVAVLDTGELFLKQDNDHERVYGNIHFSQLGYGAYLSMSEKTYNKQQSQIRDILNSYKLIEE